MYELKFSDYVIKKYKDLGNFHEGLAQVRDYKFKFGYINKEGEEVIPCQFKEARDFSEGLAAVCNEEGKWGYIDKKGNLVIPYQFKYPGDFSEGLAAVCNEEGKWGYIDKKGDFVIPCQFKAVGNFSEGKAAVCTEEGKWIYIDKKGNSVITKLPSDVYCASKFKNGFAILSLQIHEDEEWSRCSFVDQNGKITGRYRWATNFDESGTAIIQPYDVAGYYQVINKRFEIVDDFMLLSDKGEPYGVLDFSEGIILFVDGCYHYFYDYSKKEVFGPFIIAGGFSDGIAVAGKGYEVDALCGFIDRQGASLMLAQFRTASNFHEALAVVIDKDNNRYYIDKNGNKKIENPIVFVSVLEIEGLKIDKKITKGAIVCIEAETEEELNEKKLEVLETARELIDVDMRKKSKEQLGKIDAMAYSIPMPKKRALKMEG